MLQEINLRLKMIYNMMPNCEIMGDVGTDHGFLPIYCIQTGKCKKAIASDLREGPLCIANKNISENQLSDKIELMLSNGLNGYLDKKCDVIVIAGMGGLTICNILNEWMSLCKNNNYFPGNNSFILQPNTHEYEVRKLLWDNKFEILDEQAIRDGSHVYIAINTRFNGNSFKYTEKELYLGNILPYRKNSCDIEYLRALYTKYNNILKGLLKRKESNELVANRIKLSKTLLNELEVLI